MSDSRKYLVNEYWKMRAGNDSDVKNRSNKTSDNSNAIKRKNKSNEKISKMGIPICLGLPVLEDEMINDMKSVDEICKRSIACLISTQIACDINDGENYVESKNMFYNLLKEFGVEKSLNKTEERLFNGTYSLKDAIAVTWTYECNWVLVWALGLIDDDISIPSDICDFDKAIQLVSKSKDFNDFKSKCKLRNKIEILDMLDLYYRYHWACVEKRIDPETNIANLNPEVVYERRRGLEWIFAEEDDWFDISLDT